MENLVIANVQKSLGNTYIPFQEFQEQMGEVIPSPYNATFSFSKLVQELKAKSALVSGNHLAETISFLEELENEIDYNAHNWESFCELVDVEHLMIHIFPSLFFKEQLGFIQGPFENHAFRFRTKAFQELTKNENYEVKVGGRKLLRSNLQNIIMAGTIILNEFYDQEVEIYSGEDLTVREKQTKMERHFRFDIHLDYLEVKAVKPLKKLCEKEIQELLNNLNNAELWMKHLPPENFVFEGFIVGFLSDITKDEIISTLKEMADHKEGKSDHQEDLNYIEILARSYLNMPDLRFGVIQTIYGPWIESLSWSLLRSYDVNMIRPSFEDVESAYGEVLDKRKTVIIGDLNEQGKLSPLEQELSDQSNRSLLLAPLFDNEENIISIFELASPEPYRFNQLTILQLENFISLIEAGSVKFIQEMNNSVRLTIQQEFTSIHPSVEWKFRKVASKYYWDRVIERKQVIPDPVAFKDVYPLYGQADIVSSSKQRNESIQADMEDNLEKLHALLIACRKSVAFHLFDVYAEKVQDHLERLRNGEFVSSDESVIVELLTDEIHPLLRKIRPRFPQLPQEQLNLYFNGLDAELDIVYRARKAYEDSVILMNQTISSYLLEEQEKMQRILPHYFEMFQTDGIEYNLYLGQSILEEAEFHPFYLRDFRLWQLISMCEITRLVEHEAQHFPVPLTTAQLIFIYNSSLSIRFRMDEKQFDVDGAYNVRYEILKKRIDKAYIKGTDERLTQAGKISIVWLQEKDRVEYQEYLDHLVRNAYIDPEIEDLELDRMQGVEGLKAIRIKVI